MRKSFLALAGVIIASISLPSVAATVNFGCITNNNAGNCTTGEAQLTVDLTDIGSNQVNFRFINASGGSASAITEVYFDDGTLFGLSTVTHSAGDPWTGGSASPGNLPGGSSISPSFVATSGFVAESNPPPPKNGVIPGEYLDVVFDLLAGVGFSDTVAALGDGSLRIGMHVTAFGDGGSESFVNNPVPVPAAVWLFGSGLLGLVGIARRKKQ